MPSKEEWRPVVGFPGYEVSSTGRVLSHQRKTPRVLSPEVTWDGYERVVLVGPSGNAKRKIHHLVAEAFIGPRPEGQQVRHLDGDSRNNQALNLAFGSHSENMQDRLAHGTHPQASLTKCQRGHAFDAANTYVTPGSGKRKCRACARSREALRKLDTLAVSA